MIPGSFESQFNALLANGSPLTLAIAANHLMVFSDAMEKEADGRERVLWAVSTWLNALKSQQGRFMAIVNGQMPRILALQRDWAEDPDALADPSNPALHTEDLFDRELRMTESARRGNARPAVRPSHVPEPGPLDPKSIVMRDFDDEDLLRTYCVYGARMDPKGKMNVERYFAPNGEQVLDLLIARMYRRRLLRRTWPGVRSPDKWQVDAALVEDLVLVTALVHGPIHRGEIAKRVLRLEPYVRSMTRSSLLRAASTARQAWERRGVLMRCDVRTVKVRSDLVDQLKSTLFALWTDPPIEDPNNPAPPVDGRSPDPLA